MVLCLLPVPWPVLPHRMYKGGVLHQQPVQPVVDGWSLAGAGLGVRSEVMSRGVQTCMSRRLFGGDAV